MKKTFLFGILALILVGVVLAQEKVTEQRPTEVENYQAQIDSLKSEVEKVKKDACDRAIEGANRSIDYANFMIQLLILIVAILGGLGIFGYIKTGKVRERVEKELDEIRNFKESAKEDYQTELQKVVTIRQDVETLRTKAENFVKEIETIHKDITEILGEIKTIDKGIDKKAATTADANRLYTEADLHIQKSEYEEAIDNYKEITELVPDHVYTYNNWGAALLELGKLKSDKIHIKEGLGKLDTAINIDNKYARAWYNKAFGHTLLKEKPETLASLREAINLNPRYKEKAKADDDFKDLWDDEDFKKLVE